MFCMKKIGIIKIPRSSFTKYTLGTYIIYLVFFNIPLHSYMNRPISQLKTIRLDGHTKCMREVRNAYIILVQKHE